MRFVLWFEPERVAPNTQIAQEHPEWLLGKEDDWRGKENWGKVFNLGNPEARQWMTELLSKRISEYGVDIYREDFNIDPLRFWQEGDTPDRQGITEIKFMEGLYEMWDTLLARHPGLVIDNCASGGRRIDLETCMRSVAMWRSDTSCWPGHSEWNQAQSYMLGHYVPLMSSTSWDPDSYTLRSCSTMCTICEFDYLSPDFNKELAKAVIAEVKENQKYWYGDTYALTPSNTSLDQLAVYQFHRADLNEGLILAFRRPKCEYIGVTVNLKGLDSSVNYVLEFIDDAKKITTKTITGRSLITEGLDIKPGGKGNSLVIRYKPTG
jgi:alpha-galactosidase